MAPPCDCLITTSGATADAQLVEFPDLSCDEPQNLLKHLLQHPGYREHRHEHGGIAGLGGASSLRDANKL